MLAINFNVAAAEPRAQCRCHFLFAYHAAPNALHLVHACVGAVLQKNWRSNIAEEITCLVFRWALLLSILYLCWNLPLFVLPDFNFTISRCWPRKLCIFLSEHYTYWSLHLSVLIILIKIAFYVGFLVTLKS